MKKLETALQPHLKAVVAFVGVVASYLYTFNLTNPNHWVSVVLGVLTVLGVHVVPNTTPVEPPVAPVETVTPLTPPETPGV